MIMKGDCYKHGWYVKQDYAKAVEWYKKSAAQGNAAAQRSQGNSYAQTILQRLGY